MKTFLKITGGILIVVILAAVGLNLYFTDERLKATVMPHIDQAVGREVQVDNMSLSFFSTFPSPGVTITKMNIPGESAQDTVVALDELAVGVKLFSLLGDEIEFSEIELTKPVIYYTVYEDSTTNLDFLMSEDSDTTSGGTSVNIPYFEITDGDVYYTDHTSDTEVKVNDMDSQISLRFADVIISEVNLNVGGLSATVAGSNYITGLPLSLSETSTIDLDEETAEITEGTFSIKGLALNISGNIQDWGTNPAINLTFNSSSDNFGELLRLVPEAYESQVEGLETQGTLAINGTVNGTVGGENLPVFDATFEIKDGYLKNPDLNQPIEDIQLLVNFSNDLLSVESLNAKAGSNQLAGNGRLQNPLEENGEFELDINGNIDLSTVSNFIALNDFDIESLAGELDVNATASGNRSTPEQASFNGEVLLQNGLLKYAEVPEPIEGITIDARGSQQSVQIRSMSLNTAGNTFSLNGSINNPLDSLRRSVDVQTELDFNLATVKDFYPINPDTLEMEGQLTAQARLQGKADQIEQSVQSGNINLTDGYIHYKPVGQPVRDISLETILEGNRMTIVNAGFRSGDNDLKMSGLITDYLSESRKVNLDITGHAELDEISNYYELEGITSISGSADMNLKAEGPVNTPSELALNGNLILNNLNAEGDSLPQPVQNLNAELDLTPASATLRSFTMKLGSSDIDLTGSFQNYMEMLKEEEARSITPQLTGTFTSNYFNLDELIDWTDTTETDEKVLIYLPDLNTSLSATINQLVVTGVDMRNLQASASTTPEQIRLEEASINMFEGAARGAFVWDVPKPDSTIISFQGSLDSLRAESFFLEYNILGEDSNFHEYISGAFSTEVDYSSVLNAYLQPQLPTADMDGSFAMTKSRLQGHPVQEKVADFLKTKEFRNMALDEWKSSFDMEGSVLKVNNLRLTSGDIGLELNGSNDLAANKLNYNLSLLLPPRFKKGIATVITQQAADALTQENGTVMVPLKVTGSMDDPQVKPNEEVIRPIVEDYLKDRAGNTLKKLFGGG